MAAVLSVRGDFCTHSYWSPIQIFYRWNQRMLYQAPLRNRTLSCPWRTPPREMIFLTLASHIACLVGPQKRHKRRTLTQQSTDSQSAPSPCQQGSAVPISASHTGCSRQFTFFKHQISVVVIDVGPAVRIVSVNIVRLHAGEGLLKLVTVASKSCYRRTASSCAQP